MPAAPNKEVTAQRANLLVVRVRDCARISLFGSSLT